MCNFYFLYIDKYQDFKQLPYIVQNNRLLGDEIPSFDDQYPKSSYQVPDFAGFSGVKVQKIPEKPEFIVKVGMDMSDMMDDSNMKMNQVQDPFFQGDKINGASSTAIDAKGRFLFVFHRGSRVWEGSTFTWSVGPDPNNFFKTNSQQNQQQQKLQQIKPTTNWNLGNENYIQDNTIKIIDAHSGQELFNFGKNSFLMPHGIHIDDGNNYLYVTDVGNNQVYRTNFSKNIGKYYKYKYDTRGREPLEDDRYPTFKINPRLSSPEATEREKLWQPFGDNKFCMPTDVMTHKFTKNVFISDGYCNNRIAEFDSSGNFIRNYFASDQFQGKKSVSDVSIVHSVAVFEEKNWVCGVARQRGQIVCFDIPDVNDEQAADVTTPIKVFQSYGKIGRRIFSIRKFDENRVVGINGPIQNPGIDRIPPLIFIWNLETDIIEKMIPFRDFDTKNGGLKLQNREFSPHLLDVYQKDKNLYVADIENGIFASVRNGLVSDLLEDFSPDKKNESNDDLQDDLPPERANSVKMTKIDFQKLKALPAYSNSGLIQLKMLAVGLFIGSCVYYFFMRKRFSVRNSTSNNRKFRYKKLSAEDKM